MTPGQFASYVAAVLLYAAVVALFVGMTVMAVLS